MSIKFFLQILVLQSVLLCALSQNRKPFDLLESISPEVFGIQEFAASWITDEDLVYKQDDSYIIHNVNRRSNSIILSPDIFQELTEPVVTISSNFKYALAEFDRKSRVHTTQKCQIYDITSEQYINVSNGDDLQLCQWSKVPDSSQLVYVQKNNLFAWNDDGTVIQFTNTGVPGVLFNGVHSKPEVWISPRSDFLVYATRDYSKVEPVKIPFYGEPGDLNDQYTQQIETRYSKAGSPILKTTVTVANAKLPGYYIDLPAPTDDEYYLGNVAWMAGDADVDNIVNVMWINRHQKSAIIYRCYFRIDNPCTEKVTLERSIGWIDTHSQEMWCEHWSGKCFYIDDIQNGRQIFSFSDGSEIVQETDSPFTVNAILGYDHASTDIFFTAVPLENPEQQHVYRGDKCVSCNIVTPEGNLCTFATAEFSQSLSYYALTCNGPDLPVTKIISTATDRPVIIWQDNEKARENLASYQRIHHEFLRVPLADGFEAAVKLTLPEGVNLETTDNKYPMIVHAYDGPNSANVINTFNIDFTYYLVSTHNIIYVQIDGRGTSNKGLDMLYGLNNQLGAVDVENHIEVTKFLQDNFEFIDSERTGIWGSNYGGFATLMTLVQDTTNVFKCGIAVSPIASMFYYDSFYAERFLGNPKENNNMQRYTNTDLTRRVNELKNHKFMIIHGNADGDAHYQNSMMLSRALQKEEILFQQVSYPDEDNSLVGVRTHMYSTMDKFWKHHLAIDSEN